MGRFACTASCSDCLKSGTDRATTRHFVNRILHLDSAVANVDEEIVPVVSLWCGSAGDDAGIGSFGTKIRAMSQRRSPRSSSPNHLNIDCPGSFAAPDQFTRFRFRNQSGQQSISQSKQPGCLQRLVACCVDAPLRALSLPPDSGNQVKWFGPLFLKMPCSPTSEVEVLSRLHLGQARYRSLKFELQ